MAKQLVADRGAIFVPKKEISRTIYGPRKVWSETLTAVVQDPGVQSLEGCKVEKAIRDVATSSQMRRPDVLASLDGRPLAIEIRNTHGVDSEKLDWLRDQQYSVLEIFVGDLSSLPIDQLHEALERRLFEASRHSVWLVHAKTYETKIALAAQEEQVRRRWLDRESELIAVDDAREARARRKAEWLESVRDVEAFKLAVDQCTLRIGRNQRRVSLKIHGYASEPVFEATKNIARKHHGQFNSKARCWEFYRNDQTDLFFRSLCDELQQMDWLGIHFGQIGTIPHASVEMPSTSASRLPVEANRLRTTYPDLQDEFVQWLNSEPINSSQHP